MKKIMLAMLAVVMLASCGGKDPVSATVNVFGNAKENIAKVNSADELISALEVFTVQLDSVKNEYKDVFEKLQFDSVAFKLADEKMTDAAESLGVVIADKLKEFEPTREQAVKIIQLLQGVE